MRYDFIENDIGYDESSYSAQHIRNDGVDVINYEGNNLSSTETNRSSFLASGESVNLVFYNNYANKVELSASDHSSMIVDSNTAAGASITNDNAFTLLKNNYADDATIINKNNGNMIIDGNAVSGAVMTNDNSTMNIYHNDAAHATINNTHGGSITALGNNISDSIINNEVDSKFVIGDCDSAVCQDTRGTTATNLQLNN